MADTKLSALTEATTIGATDELYVNDSGTSKRIQASNAGVALLTAAGVTASVAELNYCDVTAAGTAQASKALVLGANKNTDTIVVAEGGLYIGAGAGTAMTASAAELNFNDGPTAGVATASKTLVLGADKNVDTIAIAASGLKIGAGAGTAVTATAAELNTLASVTAGTAAASKAVVLNASKGISTITSATITTLTTTTANITTLNISAVDKTKAVALGYVNIGWTTGTPSYAGNANHNITSIADTGTGVVTITWDVDPAASHIAVGSAYIESTGGTIVNIATGSTTVASFYARADGAPVDPSYCSIVIFDD